MSADASRLDVAELIKRIEKNRRELLIGVLHRVPHAERQLTINETFDELKSALALGFVYPEDNPDEIINLLARAMRGFKLAA